MSPVQTTPSAFPPDLQAALKHLQAQSTTSQPDLQQHLITVLKQIVQLQPANPYQSFESVSSAATQVKAAQQPATSITETELAQVNNALITQLATVVAPTVDAEGEPIEPVEAPANLPDLFQQLQLLYSAGVSPLPGAAPSVAIHQLQTAVQHLVVQQQQQAERELTDIRFFGVVNGTQQNYYIIECKPADDNGYPERDEVADDEASKDDAYGSGVNTFLYYATNSITHPQWQLLPFLPAHALQVSRNVRRYLTGSLTANVCGFPRFPYSEAVLLRAIVQRISASTIISPKSAHIYEPDNDDQNVIVNEEWPGATASDLQKAENWTHTRRNIMLTGKDSVQEEEEEIDEDDAAALEAKRLRDAQKEPVIPQLRSLEQDRLDSSKTAWSFRLTPRPDALTQKHIPDTTKHLTEEQQEQKTAEGLKPVQSQSVAVARSLVWNGAVTVAQNQQYVSVYIGYGQKHLDRLYQPPSPPQPPAEYSSSTIVEQADVTVEPPKRMETNDDGEEVEVVSEDEEEEDPEANPENEDEI